MDREMYGNLVEGGRMSLTLEKKVQLWNKERIENNVSWDSFAEANTSFKGDYGIVHHPETPYASIFGDMNGEGQYTVTTLDGIDEATFMEKVGGKKAVVFIQCMDKRCSTQAYNEIKKKLSADQVLISLSLGGGIVQQDTITREGKDVQVFRSQALATELSYIHQHAQVDAVYATGHDCQCGACKFYNDDRAVHETLGVSKGDEKETRQMGALVEEGIKTLVPAELQSDQKVKGYVVHINPATDVFEDFVELN